VSYVGTRLSLQHNCNSDTKDHWWPTVLGNGAWLERGPPAFLTLHISVGPGNKPPVADLLLKKHHWSQITVAGIMVLAKAIVLSCENHQHDRGALKKWCQWVSSAQGHHKPSVCTHRKAWQKEAHLCSWEHDASVLPRMAYFTYHDALRAHPLLT
jgi:hypothetical protein